MSAIDPGPAPASLVVRALDKREGEGFYARLSPRPLPPLETIAATLLGFGAAGVALGLLFASEWWLRAEITLGIVLFGVLLQAFAHLSRWFPVEITVDDQVVNWNGERIPMSIVRDCTASGGTVHLLGDHGCVLGSVQHIADDAAQWLALAVRASLPTPNG